MSHCIRPLGYKNEYNADSLQLREKQQSKQKMSKPVTSAKDAVMEAQHEGRTQPVRGIRGWASDTSAEYLSTSLSKKAYIQS